MHKRMGYELWGTVISCHSWCDNPWPGSDITWNYPSVEQESICKTDFQFTGDLSVILNLDTSKLLTFLALLKISSVLSPVVSEWGRPLRCHQFTFYWPELLWGHKSTHFLVFFFPWHETFPSLKQNLKTSWWNWRTDTQNFEGSIPPHKVSPCCLLVEVCFACCLWKGRYIGQHTSLTLMVVVQVTEKKHEPSLPVPVGLLLPLELVVWETASGDISDGLWWLKVFYPPRALFLWCPLTDQTGCRNHISVVCLAAQPGGSGAAVGAGCLLSCPQWA